MARTTYISAATAVTVGASFSLTAGQSRRFYANPPLQEGEKVEAQREAQDGWDSLGMLLTAEGNEAGLLYNDRDQTENFRLIKFKNRTSTAIEYDS